MSYPWQKHDTYLFETRDGMNERSCKTWCQPKIKFIQFPLHLYEETQKLMVTKLHNTNLGGIILFLFSYPFLHGHLRLICHCVRIHISTSRVDPSVLVFSLSLLLTHWVNVEGISWSEWSHPIHESHKLVFSSFLLSRWSPSVLPHLENRKSIHPHLRSEPGVHQGCLNCTCSCAVYSQYRWIVVIVQSCPPILQENYRW